MTYAAILVHAEADPAARPRLELAAELANRFDAALIGIAAEMYAPEAATAPFGYVDPELLAMESRRIEGDLGQAEAHFKAVAAAVRKGADWRSGVALPAGSIAREARAADLIVAGRERRTPGGPVNVVAPGDLVMQAGRPVLIAPEAATRLDADSVVVAWKDTREARRAAADALPILRRARQVLVVEIAAESEAAAAAERTEDVAAFLRRHGANAASTVRSRGDASTAERLIETAQMQEAGLIVAGAYGHSRLGEWAFGGATRELLARCPVALLLSH